MGTLAKKVQSNPSYSGRTYTCRVVTMCEDDEDRKVVASVLADREMTMRAKARTLGVHPDTIVKHQEKRCACYRDAA